MRLAPTSAAGFIIDRASEQPRFPCRIVGTAHAFLACAAGQGVRTAVLFVRSSPVQLDLSQRSVRLFVRG